MNSKQNIAGKNKAEETLFLDNEKIIHQHDYVALTYTLTHPYK